MPHQWASIFVGYYSFPLRNFKWEILHHATFANLVATYWKKCITVLCYNFVKRVMGQKMLYMALGKRAILWNRFHRFERVFTSKEIFIEDFRTKNTFFLVGHHAMFECTIICAVMKTKQIESKKWKCYSTKYYCSLHNV